MDIMVPPPHCPNRWYPTWISWCPPHCPNRRYPTWMFSCVIDACTAFMGDLLSAFPKGSESMLCMLTAHRIPDHNLCQLREAVEVLLQVGRGGSE